MKSINKGTKSLTQPELTIAEVALNLPLGDVFHYRVPASLRGVLRPGCRVAVPFGRRGRLDGVCVGLLGKSHLPDRQLRDVSAALDSAPLFDGRALDLARWIGQYYACSLGEALAALLPAGGDPETAATVVLVRPKVPPGELREEAARIAKNASRQARVLRVLADADGEMPQSSLCRQADADGGTVSALEAKGWLEKRQVKVRTDPFRDAKVERVRPPELTAEQSAAMGRIASLVDAAQFRAVLLHGVTGSGKTEIYLRALQRTIKAGRQGIVLVPEISLTPQTVRRFRERFERVAVLHSGLTDRERRGEWRRIREGKADVVVGARSAVFAPTPDLGLVVVDEEHENAFKQDSTPRYHARDVAVVRASRENALALLGSATPSLESYSNALSGKYELIELRQRVRALRMPPVEIVDMGAVMSEARRFVSLSPRLRRAMDLALNKGEQAILFLNRRGFATSIVCPQCGYGVRCDQCDVALTYHKAVDLARCHYCLHEERPPDKCPQCGTPGIKQRGQGTQRVEEEIQRKFPDFPAERMDTDSMRGRGKHQEVLGRFQAGETRILIGTQMIAKGLDFPNVTVVGVLNADMSLNLPDFRAAERTFQLLAQVAGRAGRGDAGGRVFVQTFSPKHECVLAAAAHDYRRFAEAELAHRREYKYPPFCRMARVVCESKNPRHAEDRAAEAADAMRNAGVGKSVHVMGPAPAPLSLIRGKTRWHVCIKAPDSAKLHQVLAAVKRGGTKGVQVQVDVDPASML